MKILLLNQYVPPDASPTALLLGDLARILEQEGHEVRLVGSGSSYGVRRRGWGRWLHEGWSLLRMMSAAVSGPKPGAVIVLSSPPCLLLVGVLVARVRGARLLHWVMDVYPETAVALGECGWWAGEVLGGLMGWAYRSCAKVVVLDDDMAQWLEKRHGIQAEVLPPWPPELAASDVSARAVSGRRIWMYSGNLGRAHDWETLVDAQEILEREGKAWDLVIQGGGSGYEEARLEAERRGLKHCRWLPYVPREQLMGTLMEAEVLVATRLPCLRGLLWPSKLAVMQSLPRTILWVGERHGAVARMLSQRGGVGIFSCGQSEEVARWLAGLPGERLPMSGEPIALRRRRLQEQALAVFANALK
ncbi:MAG: glycosyltransferase [Candidatus Methylacidiphilales bacterium]|nr:glycosyltransferase [Candidatus Methylacidiphilales bacterium]